MSITVARYTFSSWLRKGIGNRITEQDHLGTGASATKERASVPIDVTLNTENVHKEFALIGPGDIIGINPQMVVRTEPLNWITNFEPNYLPFIEFYDEDFVWRYTPASGNGARLRPWLSLLVLEQSDNPEASEFVRNDKRLPLPTITVNSTDSLPPPDQIWAWAHVHTNQGYDTPTEFEQFLLSLHDLNNPNSDKIISRLVCPRKLKPSTAYQAFVVPTFETGRLAGLGQPTANLDAQQPAWAAGQTNTEIPIYYEWHFRTGENADFESLVKLLQPRPMDERVGIRDMDGSKPGFGMINGTDIGQIDPPPDQPNIVPNQMIIGLEGALKAPTTTSRPKAVDPTKPFFPESKSILNLPADLAEQTNNNTDPVVSPPIYGENHALQHRIDPVQDGWLNELNRDPRNRVPAGFGTTVVQNNQEDYVARAWAQVKNILAANRRIRNAVFSMTAVKAIATNFVQTLKPAESLAILAPLLTKVKGSPTTLFHQLENSHIPVAATSSAFRRIVRSRGAYGKRLRQADSGFNHADLITKLNDAIVTAAPPKQVPKDLVTDKIVASRLPASNFPGWLQFILDNRLGILAVLLLLLVVIGFATGAWLVCGVAASVAIGGYIYSGRWETALNISRTMSDPQAVHAELEAAPAKSDFRFTVTDPVTSITSTNKTEVTTASLVSSDSANALHFNSVSMRTVTSAGEPPVEAKNFRAAAIRLNERLALKAPEPQAVTMDINSTHGKLMDAIDPAVTFPKLVASQVRFTFNPQWLLNPDHLIPAMAYPDFPDAMYEKLRDISSELFLPNLQLIPPNTISLLITNPPFIESYMTGLNHEFGRELLWREYPTDQRGSYFRQFWDVKGIVVDDPDITPEQLAERYKDITPIDQWPTVSPLGSHRNPQRPAGSQLVLLVRGELLKKYPNTVIYAQKAHIFKDKNGVADPTQDPVIQEVKTDTDMKTEIKFPLFRAEIDPDIRFFGFDMKISDARGADDPKTESDDWGWYFVIQQSPGEPRFGMDIDFIPDDDPTTPITWDDLSWVSFDPNARFISTAVPPAATFFNQLSAPLRAQWGTHSADMASVLYQKPVMIAVRAREMLENLDQP
jgi:hypothetical protein